MRIILAFLILSVLYTGAALAQLYVTNSGDDTLTIIPASGNNNITVDVGRAPSGVAVTPDGSHVYVVNAIDGTVSVIQTSDNTVVDTVDVGNPSEPLPTRGIAVTPDGKFVYVANPGGNNVCVIRTSDNTVVDTVQVGSAPTGVAISLPGDFVIVTNSADHTVSFIQTSDNKVVLTLTTGNTPNGVAMTPDNDVWVSNNASDNVIRIFSPFPPKDDPIDGPFPTGKFPTGVASGANSNEQSSLVYVANSGSDSVSIFFTNSLGGNQLAQTVDIGKFPVSIVSEPDGWWIYATSMGGDTVDIINYGNFVWTYFGTYTVGKSPIGIAAYINTDNDSLSNSKDTDADNDGITNNDETSGNGAAALGAIALRNVDPNDPDGDRFINLRDLDSDGDCIPDHFEAGGGNDSDKDGFSDNFVDVDMDGLHNEHDPDQIGNSLALPDTDKDGTPDFLDQDSDNDGRTDAEEAGGLDENGDGIHDELEDLNRDGLADACHPDTGTPLPILDLNSNGVPDHLEAESNNGSSSCALAAPGAAPSFPLYLLIPAFILINRLWRRRTN